MKRPARSMSLILIVFSFFLPVIPFAGAAEDPAPDPVQNARPVKKNATGKISESDEILVIARKRRESSFSSSRSVEKISRRRLLQTAPRSVSEALTETPGVFVQKTNHGGGSPILRGLIGPQVLITIDGVRLNHAAYRTGPLQYLNLFDPFMLGSIEVLRGAGSVLYGSDAMGGVLRLNPVSFTPLAYRDAWTTTGQIVSGFRSADRGFSGGAMFGGGGRGFALGGALSGFVAQDLDGGGSIGAQPHSSYNTGTGLFRALWTRASLGALRDVSLTGNYLFGRILDAGRADNLYTKLNYLVYDNTDHLAWLRLEFAVPVWTMQAQLVFSFQRFYEQKDTSLVDADYVTLLSTTRDHTWVSSPGLDATFQFRPHRNLRVQAGGMFQYDTVTSDQVARDAGQPWIPTGFNGLPDGSTSRTWGLFAFVDVPFWAMEGLRVNVSAGSRVHGAAAYAPAYATLPSVDYDHTSVVFFSSISANWARRWSTSLVFSQGFRAPSLHESAMLGDEGKAFHVPNPDLRPESLDGLEWVSRLHLPGLTMGVSLYASRLTDIILRRAATWEGQTAIDGKDVVENYNGNEGWIYGADGHFDWSPLRRLHLLGVFAWTRGEEHRDDGTKVPLSRIPPLSGQLTVRAVQPTWWTGSARILAEAFARGALNQDRLSPEDLKDARIPDGGTPAWYTLNLRAGLTWDRPVSGVERVSVFFTAENLLDFEYKYHGSGVYGPGRGIGVNFSADF
ncbi:TonB-dependent receptor plug domain-containing protein [Myxococcota bacterium]|nr:TonB-dependent receptor plug domain-containing protein [Myxococcota bacterium]